LHKHVYGQFDPPHKIVPDLPREFDEIVCRLMEKDPAKRPADGLVLLRQLESVQRKVEQRSGITDAPPLDAPTRADNLPPEELGDNPGLATMMSREIRRELESQNRGGPIQQWFNQPWVLATLFVLCVGVIVWSIWFRPIDKPVPDDGANAGPSARDRLELNQALAALDKPLGAAEHFYRRGLQLCGEGDAAGALRVWKNLVRVFEQVESEQNWVLLAKEGLAKLEKRSSEADPFDAVVKSALAKADELFKNGQRDKAEEIWWGLEDLYRDNPAARQLLQLRRVRQERKQ
jgi:serine/threonine-protein kinase